jgi:predicted nucleic acid-binding protein
LVSEDPGVRAPDVATIGNPVIMRSARDPNDWGVVAAALVVGGGVWTNDDDFLGTGIPTWTTRTLTAWLLHT